MGLSGIISYPYSQARYHLAAAPHSTVWGGYAVHYLAGTLELIPVLNYLVVLVDLVVSRILGYIFPNQLKNRRIEISIQKFFQDHQIQMKPSLLSEAIKEIQGGQKSWAEPSNDGKWDLRLSGIREASSTLLCLMGSEKEASPEYQKLKQIQEDKTEGGYALFARFKEVLEALQSSEEALNQKWLDSLSPALQNIQRPIIRSLDDYLQLLGFDNPPFRNRFRIYKSFFIARSVLRANSLQRLEQEGYFVSRWAIRKRGIEDLREGFLFLKKLSKE